MERVHYRNEVSTAPSEAIWGEPVIAKACDDPAFGFHRFDDFLAFPNAGNNISNTSHGDYMAWTSAAATIVAASEAGGVIDFYTATDGQAAALALAAPLLNMPGAAVGAAPTGKAFACEFRMKTDTLADTKHEIFAGLMNNTALSATVPITNGAGGDVLASQPMIGFHRTEADGDVITTRYYDAAQADVKLAAITASTSTNNKGETIPAFVVDTFIKLGMLYLPNKLNANGDNLSFFADGFLLNEGLTNAEIEAFSALDAAYLRLVFAYRAAASTGGTPSLDWLKLKP